MLELFMSPSKVLLSDGCIAGAECENETLHHLPNIGATASLCSPSQLNEQTRLVPPNAGSRLFTNLDILMLGTQNA